jgi:hypothetical protein
MANYTKREELLMAPNSWMVRWVGVLFLSALAAIGTQWAWAQQRGSDKPVPNLPLPAGVVPEIEQPERDVQTEYSAFFGKWGGYWGDKNPSNLIVESVTYLGDVRAIYLFALAKEEKSPKIWKVRARIEKNTLSWGDPQRGIGFEFRITADGKLKGERFERGFQAGGIVMVKME